MTSRAEEVVLAYCAGIVDADGTIGIKRKAAKGWGHTYSERVCVKQVESAAVDLLYQRFGGYRFYASPSTRRGRRLHGWQVTDRKAVTFLALVLPHLRIKAAQARNCLELRKLKEVSKRERVAPGRGHVGSARRSDDLTARMEARLARAHELNRVGQA